MYTDSALYDRNVVNVGNFRKIADNSKMEYDQMADYGEFPDGRAGWDWGGGPQFPMPNLNYGKSFGRGGPAISLSAMFPARNTKGSKGSPKGGIGIAENNLRWEMSHRPITLEEIGKKN